MNLSVWLRAGVLVAVAASVAACSGLQKNQALLDAESSFNTAKQNENVLKYAGPELQRAGKVLESASLAESAEDMTSLAYIGKVRTETAVAIADRKLATEKLKTLGKTKDQILLSARDAQLSSRDAQLSAREAELQRTQADADSLRRELLALQAVKTERGMVMTLGDVLFATAKADLQPGAMSTIKRLASFLEEYPDKTVLIEGFTDSTGSADFNQGLSERRALSVRSALLDAGASATRISTEGFGLARPVADNATAEGRQRNRRVEIVIQD